MDCAWSTSFDVVLAAAAAVAAPHPAASAFAHGFTSVVYVDATSPERDHVRTTLGLEYDLLVVSAADFEHDDALFQDGHRRVRGRRRGGSRQPRSTPTPTRSSPT